VKREKQPFDNRGFDLLEIGKIAARIGKKLRSIPVYGDATGTKITRRHPPKMGSILSGDRVPAEHLFPIDTF